MSTESIVEPFLLELVKRTNQHKVSGFFVSLFLPGGLVTGKIISRGEYLKARQIALFGGDEEAIPEAEAIDVGDHIATPDEVPNRIYLAEAVTYSGSTRLILGLWNGRLDAAIGFSLGEIEQEAVALKAGFQLS